MPQRLRSFFLIWAGIIIGVSLLATPAKFLAPDPSLAELLQVGRVTFRVMAITEFVLLALACVLVVVRPPVRRRSFLWPLIIAGVLLVQYAILLPYLNIQTDQVMAGQATGETTSLHSVYVAIELAKVGLLLLLGLRQRDASKARESAT